MEKQSTQDSDGTVWATVGLPLGVSGLDLRQPSDPPALAELLNARFPSAKTTARRSGFHGVGLVDGDVYPAAGAINPGAWLYGHGHRITATGVAPNAHYPEAHTARQVFRFGDQLVAWTGDRLLILRDTDTALGSSTFWLRASDAAAGRTAALPRGIPAHLPLATDTPAPASIGGPDFYDVCETETLRVYVTINSNIVTLTVMNRATGQLISSSDVTGTAVAPVEPTLLAIGGRPMLVFRDTSDLKLRLRVYTGGGWTAEDFVSPDTANNYDAVETATGLAVVWRHATGTVLEIATFVGTHEGSVVTLNTSHPPSGNVAIAWSASEGAVGVIYESGANVYFEAFVSAVSTGVVKLIDTGATVRCLSVAARSLSDNTAGVTTEWVTYLSDADGYLQINSFSAANSGFTTSSRQNTDVMSRAQVVGDEVFIWLRSRNSTSCYLLCGATHPYIAGWADREIGITPTVPGAWNYWPTAMHPDPQDARGLTYTWLRRFNTNDDAREGNLMVGSIDFLPALSVASFGKSVYLSGSCVKNWDGRTLADAGFGDYPKAGVASQTTGGNLTVGGKYQWRVYAVYYNDQGERFQSAAVTTPTFTMGTTPSNFTLATLQINCVPAVSNTTDVWLEVYRTTDITAGGTAFYYEGAVKNDPTAAFVNFNSTISDATIATHAADPHAPTPGILADLETFIPLGCAYLATVGDRLWGVGGQVPDGVAQFSKLAVTGQGAGFDDLAGYVVLSNEGGSIRSLSAMNDAVVVFAEDRLFVLGGDGPDNYGQGGYSVPRLILAAGATSHFGTCLTQLGVLYWGAGGPLLLTPGFQVVNVGAPVSSLASTLSPVAVQVDTSRQEVVWYCGSQAILLNYHAEAPRWARWAQPEVVGGCDTAVVTSGGRVLTEDAAAPGDDGAPFAFTIRTGEIRPESLRQGHTLARMVGLVGQRNGEHTIRFRVFYNGAPLWADESTWAPDVGTGLATVNSVGTLKPAEVDDLKLVNRAGQYGTHRRMRKQDCQRFAVEISDVSSWTPTFTPYEISLEVGARPGLGRTAVNSFA